MTSKLINLINKSQLDSVVKKIFSTVISNVQSNPALTSFTSKLTFNEDKLMTCDSSGTVIFTTDFTNAVVGKTIAINIPANQVTALDFSEAGFEIRRNDFNNSVDCIAYISYEFGKAAVSILPKVAV